MTERERVFLSHAQKSHGVVTVRDEAAGEIVLGILGYYIIRVLLSL